MSTITPKPTTICGKEVGPVGFGMLSLGILGLTNPPVDYDSATKILKTALENGANFWNGGLHYGTPTANSLHLLHHYFLTHPRDASRVVLSIKGCYHPTLGPDLSPTSIRASVDSALTILAGTKSIDIFEPARLDPSSTTPLEESIATLADLVAEGKIGGIGLSEVSAQTVRRAAAVHPIAAVEVELSLFTPEPLNPGRVVDTCRELGIPLIAYSPLGRGVLGGQFRTREDLPEGDFRRGMPRFADGVFETNRERASKLEGVAKRRGVSVAQLAIAWVCAQGAVPIPGSVRGERAVENCRLVALTGGEVEEIARILEESPVEGGRYGGGHERFLDV